MDQIVKQKNPRPHGRSAYAQAHTYAQEPGLFDVIASSIEIECLVDVAAFKGMFPQDPQEVLEQQFNIKLP